MPLGCVCPTVNNLVIMVHNNRNPFLSKAHLTDLNFNNFKIVEAMGLKIIALRSNWMASPAYQIS
jgi:hypothetical protein